MKVGTDAILLGSWASAPYPKTVLDIGTGSGVIALMLAQRYPEATVDAVEIDAAACEQANNNFQNSPWPNRLNAEFGRVQEFRPRTYTYDLIVSNPPYFRDSLKPAEASRQTARHDDSLTTRDLVDAVDRLLSDGGRFSVVIPIDQSRDFASIAKACQLHCVRRCEVRPTPNHPPKRVLMEFARETGRFARGIRIGDRNPSASVLT